MADDRTPLHVRVSYDAKAGWRNATRVYGGTMASLAEAIGLTLAEFDVPFEKLPRHWRRLFSEADEIEEARRGEQGRPRS